MVVQASFNSSYPLLTYTTFFCVFTELTDSRGNLFDNGFCLSDTIIFGESKSIFKGLTLQLSLHHKAVHSLWKETSDIENYCCPLNIKSRFEPIVVQWIQTRIPLQSPHAHMCEGYFSVSTVSGGPFIMIANDSSQSFSGCSRNPCTSM